MVDRVHGNQIDGCLTTSNCLTETRSTTDQFKLTESVTKSAVGNEENDHTVTIGKRKLPKLDWVRLNCKGDCHDNRRLVEHRIRNCQCETCYLEINKLPPVEPIREKMAAKQRKLDDREVKRAKKKAKKEIKAGKQACIRNFFRY